MPDAELIYEEVKTLSENRRAQVLDFVKHIKQEETRSIKNTAGDDEAGDPWFEEGSDERPVPCPICAKHRDPVTGELRLKPEIIAGMQEVEDMISGKKPVKWHTSLDDLDKMLGL